MELGECSTSTPRPAKRLRGDPFDGVTPHASALSSGVRKKGAWDVFINHRGCDTKHKLASTIYHTLDLIGLRAFLDENELDKGDSIPQEIHEAMRTAGLHIAIFSKRYAESPWCLAELCYMLKTGTPIIPVFYHVDPTDLRWVAQGRGCYADAFFQHETRGRYPSSMLEEWKTALERVSNLSGHVLNRNTGDEGMLLKSIVNSVLRVLKKEPLEVAKHPVAMDEIVEDFERSRGKCIQNEEHEQIVGIVGFGGSGKTTLATELYNRKISSFNRSSFLDDVRDAASKKALHGKQKKLLEDLRIKTDKSFDNVREGKGILADRLKGLRMLIVLDDVDHEDQLDALVPPELKESLGSGSLVIITTREGDVLTKWGITSIYKIKPLQHLHAKQLFCWHAFLQPFPLEGFEDLVENYIDASKGLPLSLKVIGGQLYGKRSKDYWVSQLNKIRRILPKEILDRLKVSYDALDEDEKEIFLDIACFFIGERRSRAISVWDASGWSGQCSWETLHNKCLVEHYGGKRIRMHDHLRDLGRQIAKTHSPLRICYEKKTPFKGITDTGDRRVRFKHSWCEFTEERAELSRGLLWLEWDRFEHTSIPSWLSLENIRVLHISYSERLETLWEDAQPPLLLRELLIENCRNLQNLPRSIGRLKYLKKLSLGHDRDILYNCLDSTVSRLSRLPEEFCELHSLEHLNLRGCDGLSSLPNCFGDLVNLRHLDLSFCKSLKILPESFKQLAHFEYLDLKGCNSLRSLENITNLKAIYFMQDDDLTANKTSVGQLSLSLSAPFSANLLHSICQLSELKELNFFDSEWLTTLPASLGNLSSLTTLNLKGCGMLTTLPASLGNLSSLTTLILRKSKVKSLPIEIGQLCNLQTLKIVRCPDLEELSLVGLVSLNNLEVNDCDILKKIEGLELLASLEKLLLRTRRRGCFHSIHSLGAMERLQTVKLGADNMATFEACVQSLQIESWPSEMTICGKIFPHFQSILDSFTFPGLVMVDSFVHPSDNVWSLTCQETNLSNTAVVCYLVQCKYNYPILINEVESTRVQLGKGEWIVISFLREVSRLVEDGGGSLHASIKLNGDHRVLGGRLMVGERDCIVEGFKQLFQTLCNAAPISPSSSIC